MTKIRMSGLWFYRGPEISPLRMVTRFGFSPVTTSTFQLTEDTKFHGLTLIVSPFGWLSFINN
jgi:hypothetical protein